MISGVTSRGALALIVIMVLSLSGSLFSAVLPPAHAILPEEQLSNPTDEARARALAAELRCLVCQNQTVDDSDSDFAITIRSIIREQITNDQSDDDILDYLRQRYGDYILFSPPFNSMTMALWLAPIMLLIFGLGITIWTRPRLAKRTDAKRTDSRKTKS